MKLENLDRELNNIEVGVKEFQSPQPTPQQSRTIMQIVNSLETEDQDSSERKIPDEHQ